MKIQRIISLFLLLGAFMLIGACKSKGETDTPTGDSDVPQLNPALVSMASDIQDGFDAEAAKSTVAETVQGIAAQPGVLTDADPATQAEIKEKTDALLDIMQKYQEQGTLGEVLMRTSLPDDLKNGMVDLIDTAFPAPTAQQQAADNYQLMVLNLPALESVKDTEATSSCGTPFLTNLANATKKPMNPKTAGSQLKDNLGFNCQ